MSEEVKEKQEEFIEDISRMIRAFVRCRLPSFADRLANATGKEVVETTLYEALRISRSAKDSGRPLCEDERSVSPYVAREESIKWLLSELDRDLVKGLEIVRRIAIRALALP